MFAIIGTIFSYAMNIPVFLQSFQQNTSGAVDTKLRVIKASELIVNYGN